MKLRFAAAARRELNEAAIWLELQENGLGERFLEEVAQARRLILEYPQAWHPLGSRLRRCHLKRFRYGLIYRGRARSAETRVLAGPARLIQQERYYSSLPTAHSSLTAYRSPLTAHCSRLTNH